VSDDLATLAYEASLRSLDKQEEVLGELRSRTGLLLAASSVAVSFLGERALDEGVAVVALGALAAFVVSLGASIYVLLPKRDLVFSISGSRVFEELYEFRDDIGEVHRRLAYDLDRFREANDGGLQRLLWGFRVTAAVLGAEVALLLTSLTATLG
jgi:hypothetical protein